MTTTQRIQLFHTLSNEIFNLNEERITNPDTGYPIWKVIQELKNLLKITEEVTGEFYKEFETSINNAITHSKDRHIETELCAELRCLTRS